MQSLINQLFNGDRPPEVEKLIDPTPYDRNQKLDKADEKIKKLFSTFNEEQKKLFEEWNEIHDGIWDNETDLAYRRGFQTGALLMIEIHDIRF